MKQKLEKIVLDYNSEIKSTQHGAALFFVLIILLVVTILGVTGANETLLSSKMAYNHNTQTQAFFAAEAGVNKAIQLANNPAVSKWVSNGKVSKIKSTWTNLIQPYESNKTVNNGHISSEYHLSHVHGPKGNLLPYWNKSRHVFQVVSHGSAGSGANRDIEVHISPATLVKTNSPFLAGVIARNNVSIKGRPVIASYNSKYGPYKNRLTVNHKPFINSSRYNSKIRSVVVQTCYGNIVLTGNAKVFGKVNSAHYFFSHGKPFLQSGYNQNPKRKKPLQIKRCNIFKNNGNLSPLFNKIQNSSKTQLLNKTNHTIGKSGKKTFFQTSSLKLSNITIAGNVTILVKGNLTLKGKLRIGSSASLRLLVTGTTNLTARTTINVNGSFVRKNANGKATPAIALYSNYKGNKGKAGVKLAGNSSSHIAVYAPNSKVQISGKGSIYGSVVAQNIKHTGHANIYYNNALKNIHLGLGSSSSNSAKLKSWHQL